jgi:glycosyltransferase involved in cell wall biosynthesis
MKILFTSVVDMKKSQHNRPHQFLKYLSQKHDITLICINDWWKANQFDYKEYSSEFNFLYDKINFNYLTDKKINPFMQELLFKENLKKLINKNKYDIHFNYNSLLMGYEASKSINSLFDLADDLIAMIKSSPQIPFFLKPIGSFIGEKYINKNILISKKISITNEFLASKYQIPSEKKEIIPNGVDTNLFKNIQSSKNDLGLEGFIIGYVGVLREWVNFEHLFKILTLLNRDVKILIVGKEGRFNETIKLAKKYKVYDKIIFTGNVPYSLVPKYISAMDICMIPFINSQVSQGALPLKLFEYMACEKPIISTNIPSIKKLASDIVNFYSNEKDLLNNINLLYYDKKLRLKLGNRGKELVEESYTWDKISNYLEKKLYQCI